jgi:type III restriction enzyme
MGRALRRISYAHESKEIAVNSATVTIDAFDPEYAEVYGVPFAFIPCAGSQKKLKPGILPTRVRALPEREHLAIAFPRLLGYRYEIGRTELKADFDNPGCRYTLSTENLPTTTINAPIVGESSIHTLDELRSKREQEVAFLLAKLTLEKYFRDDGQPKTERSGVHKFDADVQAWLFPQVLAIAKEWLKVAVTYKAKTYPQMLLLYEFAHDAADCIYQAIAAGEPIKKIKPILRPYEAIGSTCGVDFDTSRPVYITDGDRCHISHVVADTDSWEQKMAQVLESMDEVVCYVKNQGLGFFIPYTYGGQQRNYQPDFIVRVNDGREDLLNLIVEVSGEARADKAAKVSTAKELWLSAINGYGDFGRWEFINITDPWDAENTIKGAISSGKFDLR